MRAVFNIKKIKKDEFDKCILAVAPLFNGEITAPVVILVERFEEEGRCRITWSKSLTKEQKSELKKACKKGSWTITEEEEEITVRTKKVRIKKTKTRKKANHA